MEKHEESSQKGGLFLGILVGVAATLLVTTKRGRKLLHTLSDEGIEKIEDWEHILKDVADALEDDEFVEGDDYVVEKERDRHMQEPPVVHRVPDAPPPHIYDEPAPVHHIVPQQHYTQPAEPVRSPEVWPQPPQVHGEPVKPIHPEVTPEYAPQEQMQTQSTVSRPRTVSRRFFRGIPRRG